jgi:lysophospholipase L1-like esterase
MMRLLGRAASQAVEAVPKGYVDSLPGNFAPYITANTGATLANYWSRIARVSLPAQYLDASVLVRGLANGDGSTATEEIEFRIRVKWQNAAGVDPLVDYSLTRGGANTRPANLAYVIVSNAGPIVVDFYLQITTAYRNFVLQPLAADDGGYLSPIAGEALIQTLPMGYKGDTTAAFSATEPVYGKPNGIDVAPQSRLVGTGAGLQGGGDLTADRTLALSAAAQTSLGKADTAVQPAALSGYVKTVNGVAPDATGNVPSTLGHVQDVRYVAYGHSFGQVQSPIQNTTAAGVYPNRLNELIRGDTTLFQNLTQTGSLTAGVLTQVKATWTQGNYGVVTLLCNQNDVGARTAQATFKANVKSIIDYLRGPGFSPTIVVVLDTTCTTAGYARYTTPPTDTDVATYNQYLRDVVATYPSDGSILIADPYTGWNPSTMTGPDGQHPNDRGQAYIAQAIRVALGTGTFREGQNVGITPPSTMFYDSFNRANSTTLGTAMYGTAWTMLGSSVYGITSNRAYRSDSGTVAQESAAVVDLGKAAVDLSITMDTITTKGSGPVWHVTDINNMWALDILGTGVGNAKVYKKTSGTFAQVGAALTIEVKNTSVVRVTHTTAGVLTILVDGVQAFTATDTYLSTATKHGFRITDLSSAAGRINDIVLR